MPARRLPIELPWDDALMRLSSWKGDVALCWAAVRRSPGASWEILGVTVRGGVAVPDATYEYGELGLWSQMAPPMSVSGALVQRALLTPGTRPLEHINSESGQSYWLTSGAGFGMTGPLETPSFYFSVQLADAQGRINDAKLTDPAFGPRQPYYPTREDALLDVLYGVTRDQGRRDIFNQIVVHLPYTDAFIEGGEYVDGEGFVVRVGESPDKPGRAAGHELQAVWKLHAGERSYNRMSIQINSPGSLLLPVGAAPAYFAASLQDASGQEVDSLQWHAPASHDGAAEVPLPAEALPEAFDFLASVWRQRTGSRLLQIHRVSAAAQLSAAVNTRSDFQSRLTEVADLLQAIVVDDSLLDPMRLNELRKSGSLGRLKAAMQRMLEPPALDAATEAIVVLQNVVRLRVALQHTGADPDLPTALRRIGIAYPPSWASAWEGVRQRMVSALRTIRQALDEGLE